MTEQNYQSLFESLGRPLTADDGIPEASIAAAEERLGSRIPDTLRAFYRVAGNADDFLNSYDHFEPPDVWELHDGKLYFLAENQAVVLYAADLDSGSADPPIVMTSNREPYTWHVVCPTCSEFLSAMTCFEGSFGGAMYAVGSALVGESFRQTLERDFQPVGEVNAMWAYQQPGLAVCFLESAEGWEIFVGAADDAAISKIQQYVDIRMES